MQRNLVKRPSLGLILVSIMSGLFCPPTIAARPSGPEPPLLKNGTWSPPALPAALPPTPAAAAEIQPDSPSLPLFFRKNQGELPANVRYYANSPGMTIWVTRQGISLLLQAPAALQSAATEAGSPIHQPGLPCVRTALQTGQAPPRVIHLAPVGMSRSMRLAAWRPMSGRVHVLTGRDPRHWRTGLTPCRGVIFRNAYPGIDLVFYGQGRQLEYDVIVHPGANPRQVKFQYAGVQSISANDCGELQIRFPEGGSLTQKKPVVYQEISGKRVLRAGAYKILAAAGRPTYAFELASYDARLPLIIDPVLEYSTYLGGTGSETVMGQAMAIDARGNIFIIGTTGSSDLLSTPSAYQTALAGGSDIFVAKFDGKGTLVYATYLGGLSTEFGQGIAVDGDGQVYITGYTASDNFPIVNPLPGGDILKGGRGNYDAFVAQLSTDGSALLFSSFLGGMGRDHAFGLTLDKDRNIFVVGATTSLDFPTTAGAYQSAKPGPEGDFDAFIAKINLSAPNITYATYLGGSLWDLGYGISVDGLGNAYVIGTTFSDDLAPDPLIPFAGVADAFVARIEADGASLGYFTYLGGTDQDEGSAVVVDAQGQAYVTGGTRSPDFFTTNAWQGALNGLQDAFVAKIFPPRSLPSAAPAQIVFSTFLGGGQDDYGNSIALDGNGNLYVAGSTNSPDFPSKQALRRYAGGVDAFLTKLTAAGDALLFSTLLGGSGDDPAFSVCVGQAGSAYLLGTTTSPNFPVYTPFQKDLNGTVEDIFVTKIQERTPSMVPVLSLLLNTD